MTFGSCVAISPRNALSSYNDPFFAHSLRNAADVSAVRCPSGTAGSSTIACQANDKQAIAESNSPGQIYKKVSNLLFRIAKQLNLQQAL